MKKIFIIATAMFIFMFFNIKTAEAAITATSNGSPVITNTQVSQGVHLTANVNLLSVISAQALDPYITNVTDPTIQIPISHLYIQYQGTLVQMILNTLLPIISVSIGIGTYDADVTLLVKDIGVLPAGTYTTRVLFQNVTTVNTTSTTYTLTFTVPPTYNVSTTSGNSQITLTSANVFSPSTTVNNTTNTQVDMQANTKWNLYLNTSSIGTLKGNYYFQVLGSTGPVTTYNSTRTLIAPNQQYLLASGTQTSLNIPYGQFTPTNIQIQYSYNNTNSASGSTYLPEGTYTNNLQYILSQAP